MKRTLIITLSLLIVSSILNAKEPGWKMFFYGDLSVRSEKDVNEQVVVVSDGKTLGLLGFGFGGEFAKILKKGWNLGLGGYFGLPKKVDTELEGFDGNMINTGSISLSTIDIYLIVEKLFNIKGKVDFGLYFNGGFRIWNRKQLVNDKTYKENSYSGITELGILLYFGKKVGGQLKIGYDIFNFDFKSRLGLGIKF